MIGIVRCGIFRRALHDAVCPTSVYSTGLEALLKLEGGCVSNVMISSKSRVKENCALFREWHSPTQGLWLTVRDLDGRISTENQWSRIDGPETRNSILNACRATRAQRLPVIG